MSRLAPPRRARVRAGGRSAQVRRRVAQACLDLLAEGDAGFGPVDVARRSGVSRATLHRWWPAKADLLREALSLHTRALAVPDTGSWAGDVEQFARRLAAFFDDPVEVGQNALMASGAYPEYTAAVLEHYETMFDAWRDRVARARERGELAEGVTPTPCSSPWRRRCCWCRCCSGAPSPGARLAGWWRWSSGPRPGTTTDPQPWTGPGVSNGGEVGLASRAADPSHLNTDSVSVISKARTKVDIHHYC